MKPLVDTKTGTGNTPGGTQNSPANPQQPTKKRIRGKTEDQNKDSAMEALKKAFFLQHTVSEL